MLKHGLKLQAGVRKAVSSRLMLCRGTNERIVTEEKSVKCAPSTGEAGESVSLGELLRLPRKE